MDKKTLDKVEKLCQKYGIKSKEKVNLEHPFLTIESYEVKLNNGETIYRDKLIKNGGNGNACIIIPVTHDNKILLVIQPRVFSKRGVLVDFPAGYVDEGEDALTAAKRELKEETGCIADTYELLTTYYQDEGASDARISIVLARGVNKVCELELDKDEYLEPVKVEIEDLDELVEKEYIGSGGSQLAIALFKLLRAKEK